MATRHAALLEVFMVVFFCNMVLAAIVFMGSEEVVVTALSPQ
jgi:hypothetical protein